MNCDQVQPSLAELCAGDLDPAMAAAVREHLATCRSCRAEHQALERMLHALDAVATVEAPVDLQRLYRRAADRQQGLARRWRRRCGLAAAAAVVLLVLLGLRVQVRLDRDQFVVRWGQPAPAARAPERPGPLPPNAVQPLPAPAPPGEPAYAADVKVLRELVHALAAEVQRLDGRQEKEARQLREELARLAIISEGRWTTAERQFLTLLKSQMSSTKEEENP